MPISQIVTNSIANDAVTTADIVNAAVTPAKLSQPLTSGTAVSASSTSVSFTGIPSWVRRITVMFSGLSTNGSSQIQIQIGSTTFSTSGYDSSASFSGTAGTFAGASTGFIIDPSSAAVASVVRSGSYQLSLINSNTWVGSGNNSTGLSGQVCNACAGNSPNLSGVLDRIRLTTVNGTDTFDAGSINILYE